MKLDNINKDTTKKKLTYDFDGTAIMVNPMKSKNFPPTFYSIGSKLVSHE